QGLVHEPATTPEEVADTLPRLTTSGFDLEIIDRDDESFLVKAVERETSAAAFVNIPVALLESPVYASVRRTYAKLVSVVGKPPFTIVHGKKQRSASGFSELRSAALELAKEGIQVSRFKGLGEMNPDELRETTMDPNNRVLVRVEVEDAT